MNEQQHHDAYYDADADRVLSSLPLAESYQRAVRMLSDRGLLRRDARVLSLGCGDGRFEVVLAPHVARIVGLDISPVAVEQARARAAREGVGNAEFRAGDLTKLDVDAAGETFDVICAMGLLHHLPDALMAQVIKDCRAHLTPTGAFFSADPSARRIIRIFAGLVRGAYDKYHSPDERELVPEEVRDVFERSGYSRVEIKAYDYFSIPVGFLWPRIPGPVARPLLLADRVLRRVPGVRRYASSFAIVATR